MAHMETTTHDGKRNSKIRFHGHNSSSPFSLPPSLPLPLSLPLLGLSSTGFTLTHLIVKNEIGTVGIIVKTFNWQAHLPNQKPVRLLTIIIIIIVIIIIIHSGSQQYGINVSDIRGSEFQRQRGIVAEGSGLHRGQTERGEAQAAQASRFMLHVCAGREIRKWLQILQPPALTSH